MSSFATTDSATRRSSSARRAVWYADRVKAPRALKASNAANLVESWLAAERAAGKTKTQAVADLNAECQSDYSLTRIGEWANEKRPFPNRVRRIMLRIALPYVLKKHNIDTRSLRGDTLSRLIDELS
jgi:hypothetical protein